MKISATAVFQQRNDVGQFIATKITPELVSRGKKAGGIVVGYAKAICPVRTGAARDSIGSRTDAVGSRVITTIYMSVEYAGYIEYGTGRRGSASSGAGPYPYNAQWPGQAAHPTLRPALDTARGEISGIYGQPLLTA